MNEIKQQVLGAVQAVRSEAEAAARDQLSQHVTSLDKFAGINEEEILSFVPDKRDFAARTSR